MSLASRTCLALLASAPASALGLPATAAASLDGGDGKWVPGSVLIRFDTSNIDSVSSFVKRNMVGEDGDVKQAGRDACLVAANRAVGAKVEFASCSAAAQRRQWDFGA